MPDLHYKHMFATLNNMFPSDVCDETDWFLTEADIDVLTSGIDPADEFRLADHRDAVQDLWHSMQIGQVNLLDAIISWDRADAHLLDGSRTPTAWLRHRFRVSHSHAVMLLQQARGLRDTPQVREALLAGVLSFDQADQLLCVFTAARARYVERDVAMLIDHTSTMPVGQCRIVTRHWAARVDAEALADGDDMPPAVEPTISELRVGEILDGDTIVEGILNAADSAVGCAALSAAQRLGKPVPSGDDEALEDGSTGPVAPADPRTPAQQRADALVLIAQFFLDHHSRHDDGASIGRAHVNVVVNLDQLTPAHLTGNAETPHSLSGLDMASVLQTCCDASITRILTAGPSLTLDIGRVTRVNVPPTDNTEPVIA